MRAAAAAPSAPSRACARRTHPSAPARSRVLLARASLTASSDGGAAPMTLPVAAAATATATFLATPGPAFAAKAAKAAKAAPAAVAALGGGSVALGGLLFLPSWTPLHIGLLALASLNLLAGLSEGSGNNTAYSKFSPTQEPDEAAAAAAQEEAAAATTTTSGPAEARAWIAAWQARTKAAAGASSSGGPAEAKAWIAAWEERKNNIATGAAAAAAAAAPPAAHAPAPPTAAAAVVSSRTGMAIIYAGGLLAAALAPLALPNTFAAPSLSGLPLADLLPAVLAPACRPWLVALLLSLHFLKRELEVFFLHRYSGGIPLPTAAMISTVYTITSLQYLYFARTASAAGFYATAGARAADVGAIGLALFFVGQAGNFLHHKLLADLRAAPSGGDKDMPKKKAYLVPQGGLFSLVAAPHYLFEIIAWLGLALATQTVVPLVACTGMASYLAGRSASTQRWNEANIPGYPKERKRLVPFVW